MNTFERATKQALRFSTSMGMLSVEDLWKIPLTDLDSLAVSFKQALSKQPTESFITPAGRKDATLQLQFDVAKRIIEIRLADLERAAKAKSTREQKQKIMEIMANKQDAALQEKSLEELQAMLEGDDTSES